MAQQLNLYGNQAPPMPGQAVLGYGPVGQTYNMANPVVMTTSGIRPASVYAASLRQQQPSPQVSTPQRPAGSMYAGSRAYIGNQQGGGGFMDTINRMTGSGQPNIQTSITPGPIYSPQQTQEAVNSAVASQHVPLPWLQSRYAGRGMGVNSPGVIGSVLPTYARGVAAGQQATAQIPFQDTLADAQHILAGQTARENEAQDIYRILSGQDSVNRNFQLNSLQSLLGLLGAFA